MQLPPYDTTAPLHRQQEPPRTATHSKTQKQDMQKNKERIPPAAAINISFSYLLRAGSISRVAGRPANPPLFIIYSPAGSLPAGYFFVCRQTRPGFQHTKNAARKNAAKSKHKKHCKKIFIFLIILHIKYEDKKTSRRQNIKK